MPADVYPVGSGAVKPVLLAGRPAVCDVHAVDAAGHYRQLLQLGREEFLASAAPAALVRYRRTVDPAMSAEATLTIDEYEDELVSSEATLPFSKELPDEIDLEVYPLAKKTGASFPDRITIGRTSNNDVVINDTSISRLHAYVRREGTAWLVADAGSKNGSQLRGETLEPRRERPLSSRALLRLGDVDVTFYVAADLFTALGGS